MESKELIILGAIKNDVSDVKAGQKSIEKEISSIQTAQAVMVNDIEYIKQDLHRHIKRCDELERDNQIREDTLRKEMKPLKNHMQKVQGAGKAVAFLGVLTGAIIGIMKVVALLVTSN